MTKILVTRVTRGELKRSKCQKIKIPKNIRNSLIHCKFNDIYDLLVERAVYELEPAKVIPAIHKIKNSFRDNSKCIVLSGLKMLQSSSEP